MIEPYTDLLLYNLMKNSGDLTIYELMEVRTEILEDVRFLEDYKGMKTSDLSTAFSWKKSRKGWHYWSEVHSRLYKFYKEHKKVELNPVKAPTTTKLKAIPL